MINPSDHEIIDIQPDFGFDDCRPASEQVEFDFDSIVVDEQESTQPTPSDDDADAVDSAASAAEDIEAGELCLDSETGLDFDSPLYGDEDGGTFDWKSVDIHAENSDVPPQDDANTSSAGDDTAETEHSRSGDGAPCMGLIKLKSEHSEHSEHSRTFSSSDFDNSDWISPIYPKSFWTFPTDIGDPICVEYTKSGAIRVTALNAAYFARTVILAANLHLHHGDWYAYSDHAGAWGRLRRPQLLNVIHRCVMRCGDLLGVEEIVKLCSAHFCADVIKYMTPFPEYEDIFDHAPKNVINAKNGTIVIGNDGSVALHEHSPEFLCRDVINIDYDPTADYSDFVREAFRDVVSPEDQETIKWYAGQCALGRNFSQSILIISGEAGTGKTLVVKVIEKVIGRGNYEGLRTNMLDQRFELSRFDGKSLLVASDQCSDALMKKGAHMLKCLTGNDDVTTERKGENEHPMISGEFNVIIVSNADLPLSIDGDSGAWKRRVYPVKYDGKKPETIIPYFEDYLMRKYPEHILNWMVSGAAALFKNGKQIPQHPEMLRRIDALIQESDACYAFVKNCVIHTGNPKDVLFSFGLYNAFTGSRYFVGSGSKQIIQTKLKKAMKDVHGVNGPSHDLKDSDGKAKYGYVGYRLELSGPE